MTLTVAIVTALLAALPTPSTACGSVPTPPGTAEDDSVPDREIDTVARALESAGITHALEGPRRDWIQVVAVSDTYRAPDGSPGLRIRMDVNAIGGQPWLFAVAYDVFSLAECDHQAAAQQVLAGTLPHLGSVTHLLYDSSDATVTAWLSVPMPDGRIDGRTVSTVVEQITHAVEGTQPVLDRAMATGVVDWPDDDHGPKEPTSWLETKGSEGEPITVGWTVWAEENVWASSLVAAEGLLRRSAGWNDEERERFGRMLASEFGGAAARAIVADWLKGSTYLKQHHPAVRVRFWAPEGTEVSASVRCPGFVRGVARETRTMDGYWYMDVRPRLTWKTDALLALEQPADATFEVEVACAGTQESATATVHVQPVGIAELGLPASLPVAIYVNEMHPWVKELIAEASRMQVADALGADKDTRYADAVRQIYALWRAFRARDLRYVSLHAATDAAGAQPIRLFHEAITDAGANCADGTAAMASALRAIGFDVHLMRVPGHVFPAVYLPAEEPRHQWIYLETTRLGEDACLPDHDILDDVEDAIPEERRGGEWECFEASCQAAFETAEAATRKGNLVIVSLRSLRDAGVRPIPVAKSRVGPMPAAPDPVPLAARRARERERLLADLRDLRQWMDALPNGEPIGYARAEDIRADILVVGTDHRALGRLLRAVDGEGLAARSMRAVAALHDALVPLRCAMDAAYGDLGPETYRDLRLPPSGSTVEVDDLDGGRYRIRVFDHAGELCMMFGVHPREDTFTIDGDFLEKQHEELARNAIELAQKFRTGALADAAALGRLAEDLASEVRAGKFGTRDEATDRLGEESIRRFGKKREGVARQ